MFGGFLDEVQLSVTTFRPLNLISRVTLTRTTTLFIHPDNDDEDINGDDKYDADESDADDDDDHNDFDDLDFGQAGLVYIHSLFFLILVVLMIVLAVVVVVVEAYVFTKNAPRAFLS